MFTVSVKHQQQGEMSAFIHQNLQVGDEVALTAPDGSFVIPTNSVAPVVMIAGGIGITPFISYLSSLDMTHEGPELWLYYGNRNSQSHAFRKQLEILSQRLPRLNIVNVYDNPRPGDEQGKSYQHTGMITAALIDEKLVSNRARFYLCGPGPMVSALEGGYGSGAYLPLISLKKCLPLLCHVLPRLKTATR